MDDLERLRAEAHARLARLDADEGSLRADRADGTADDEHDPEGSTLSGEWALVDAQRRSTLAELAAIDAAFARVAAGTYGRCASCGDPIAPERMRARPTADLCIACASRR
ncbi:TraR/DksA family transcriptional regulator [Microbacterium sp. NPDC091313]